MAEAVRFELTRGANPCRFSRPVQSTALPHLRGAYCTKNCGAGECRDGIKAISWVSGFCAGIVRMIGHSRLLPLGGEVFIVKVLFSSANDMQTALQKIRAQLAELQTAPAGLQSALQLLLSEVPRMEATEFAEKPAIAAIYGGFDPQAAAVVEAALLEAGALEGIQE